ncbi:MAG: oligosaccharide flippase family protein [Candidatus Eisenbacteria bacterium]|nr:oligosaccharide flippase family protein [Candidatus Eisenbacteria bacterium]
MKRVAGNTLALFASHFSTLFFTLIQAKIIAVWLGPIGFGIYASSVAAGAIFGALMELGLPFVLLRFIPLFEARGEREKSRDLVRFSLILSSFMAVVLIIPLIAFGGRLSSLFHESPLGLKIILLASTYVAFGVLRAIIYGAFNGLSRMTFPFVFEILFQGLVTLWIFVIRNRLDVMALFKVFITIGAIVVIVSLATLWLLFFRRKGERKLTMLGAASEVSSFWKGACLMTFIGLGLENSDRLVVGGFMSFQAVSLLHVASRIMYFFKKLLFLPLLAVSPEITRKWEKGNREIRADLTLLMKIEFLLGFLVLCFVVLGNRALVLLVTSKEFQGSEPLLLFMAFLVPLACLYSSVTTTLRATGRIGLSVGSDLAWYVIYLFSGVLLIGRLGLWGMMISQAFASICILFLNIRFARVYLEFSFADICPGRLVLSAAPAFLCSAVLAEIFHPSNILVLFAVTLPVLIIFNLGVAFGGIFDEAERGRIEELLTNRKLVGTIRFLLDWPKRVLRR